MMLNRRGFLGGLLALAAAPVVAPKVLVGDGIALQSIAHPLADSFALMKEQVAANVLNGCNPHMIRDILLPGLDIRGRHDEIPQYWEDMFRCPAPAATTLSPAIVSYDRAFSRSRRAGRGLSITSRTSSSTRRKTGVRRING